MQLREILIGALRRGPVPQHIAFVMDGNRRFARMHGIETVEGHNLGFEALAKVRDSRDIAGFRRIDRLTRISATDSRGLLQIRRQSRDDLCFQHREL